MWSQAWSRTAPGGWGYEAPFADDVDLDTYFEYVNSGGWGNWWGLEEGGWNSDMRHMYCMSREQVSRCRQASFGCFEFDCMIKTTYSTYLMFCMFSTWEPSICHLSVRDNLLFRLLVGLALFVDNDLSPDLACHRFVFKVKWTHLGGPGWTGICCVCQVQGPISLFAVRRWMQGLSRHQDRRLEVHWKRLCSLALIPSASSILEILPIHTYLYN